MRRAHHPTAHASFTVNTIAPVNIWRSLLTRPREHQPVLNVFLRNNTSLNEGRGRSVLCRLHNASQFTGVDENLVSPVDNIYVNDLDATIKAHQDAKKGKIIRNRKVYSKTLSRHITTPELSGNSQSRAILGQNGSSSGGRPPVSMKPAAPQKIIIGDDSSQDDGTSLRPCGDFELDENHQGLASPWRPYVTLPGGDGLTRLHAEIQAFEQYMRLDKSEHKAATYVKSAVEKFANQYAPEGRVELVGSYSTGLASPLSDLDFRIILPTFEKSLLQRGPSPTRPKAQKASLQALFKCRRTLQNQAKIWRDVELVYGSVRLVSATHWKGAMQVQIQQHGSQAFLTSSVMMAFQSEFPTLRSLYILLKAALAVRGLDKPFTGGLSSYPLLVAIVNALKHCEFKTNRKDAARHLLFVLNFYANGDLLNTGFRLERPRTFPKIDPSESQSNFAQGRRAYDFEGMMQIAIRNPQCPHALCLQDPLNPGNDLGKKAHAVKQIQALFRAAHTGIRSSMALWEQMNFADRKASQNMLLDVLVKANYERMENARRTRRAFATWRPPPDIEGTPGIRRKLFKKKVRLIRYTAH